MTDDGFDPAASGKASAPGGSRNDGSGYRESHYLLFGSDDVARYEECFACEEAKAYLESIGITTQGSLTQARKLRHRSEEYAGFHDSRSRACDFCGRSLSGAEYERLKDGRERCPECSDTVVRGQANLETVYHQTREGMMDQYSIQLPASVRVRVVSAKRMAKASGHTFVPTKDFDPRAIGLAVNKRGRYELWFENGAPRMSLVATTVHELTHIWQYANWDQQEVKARYGELELAVYEGMAKWAEIQYLFLINEGAQAQRMLESEVERTDVYGYGLRMYLNQYPLSQGIIVTGRTPFEAGSEPISL